VSSHHRHPQVQHGKGNLSRLRNKVEHPEGMALTDSPSMLLETPLVYLKRGLFFKPCMWTLCVIKIEIYVQ